MWSPPCSSTWRHDERTGRYAVYNSIYVPGPDELYEELDTINVQSCYERFPELDTLNWPSELRSDTGGEIR